MAKTNVLVAANVNSIGIVACDGTKEGDIVANAVNLTATGVNNQNFFGRTIPYDGVIVNKNAPSGTYFFLLERASDI